MISRGKLLILFSCILILTLTACDVTSEKPFVESLDPVPNVTAIEGAQNATIRVNGGTNSLFNIDIQNVEWNTLISNGEREAFCIAWQDPIGSNDEIYEGVGIYSTAGDAQFEDINRLFSLKNELMNNDTELTWREIQVAVWILAPFQEFDMNMPVNELPESVKRNGQPNFDKEKVQNIVNIVRASSSSKSLTSFTGSTANSETDSEKTMCVIGTNEDTQTLIVPCDETAFAYGGGLQATFDGLAGAVDDNGDSEDPFAHCFPELPAELSEAKWGWTNGPLSEGFNETWPLYAGAGQCNLSKGQYSGDVEIDYSNGTVTVTFTAAPGVTFYQQDGTSETHLYVGNDKMPATGGAPGNYPNNDDVTSSSDTEVIYTVTGVTGDIYVIAHAVMDGYEEPAP